MNQLKCRFCDTPLDYVFADLGTTPLANSYIRPEDSSVKEPFYPLKAFVCHSCLLVQLGEFESPEAIFSDYAYFSSYSDTWLSHCSQYAESMIKRFGLSPESRLVEIASNDGYLLQFFQKQNIPVLGIEPALNVAKVAIEKGIPTRSEFFSSSLAQTLIDEGWQADLIIANNVLAHVPNLLDFIAGIKLLLKPGAVFTVEVPHLLNLIKQNQFDTIYHEHFSYFSFHTLEKIFASFDLTLFDVDELPTHGGSLRIYGRQDPLTLPSPPMRERVLPITSRVEEIRQKEKSAGLDRLETYLYFDTHIQSTKNQLLRFLTEASKEGKTVAAYGAPAKGNTLLNYCGVNSDLIPYTVDKNPVKQGCFLPGSRIPVFSPDKLHETRPEYLLILPWNLRDEIIEQQTAVREWGCKFVTPIPAVEILL